MGAPGSGGARVGSGSKPKDDALAALHGSRQRAKGKQSATFTAPPEPVDPPVDMPEDQLAVWVLLAPHALAARTLTKGTAESFRDLCRAVVIRNGILAKIQEDGWTHEKVSVDGAGVEHRELKKHPLVSDHRGWEQRVEAGRARFRLAPFGKEIVPSHKPVDPFDEFEASGVQ